MLFKIIFTLRAKILICSALSSRFFKFVLRPRCSLIEFPASLAGGKRKMLSQKALDGEEKNAFDSPSFDWKPDRYATDSHVRAASCLTAPHIQQLLHAAERAGIYSRSARLYTARWQIHQAVMRKTNILLNFTLESFHRL
jgi:hypothetical protein